MKCFECPARREVTDGLTNPPCKAGVYPQTLKSTFRVGCRYGSKQIDAWLKRKAPPTHKDVLLKTWAQDTEEMAHRMVWYSSWNMRYHSVDGFGENLTDDGFKTIEEAYAHQIAYLNSAAEVGK